MARKNLEDFLKKLEKELDKDNDYRKLVSDVKAHQFYISKEGLLDQALYQAEIDGVTRSKLKIQKATDQYFKDIVSGFAPFDVNKGPDTLIVFDKKVTANSFSITFQADMAKIKKVSPQGLLMPGGKFQEGTTFNAIKFIIAPAKQKFQATMRKIYSGKGVTFNPTHHMDIGHDESAAVYDNKVSDALLSAGEIPPAAFAMEELAAILALKKDDKTNVISCTLESSSKNRSHGNYLSKKAAHFNKLITKALDRLPSLALTKGSDTPVERAGKKAGKRVIKEFKKVKSARVTVKEDDLKIEETTTLAKLKLRRKVTSGKSRGRKAKQPRNKERKKSPASAPLMLMANLNKRLPQVVAKNMVAPALEYQTGRFAESVEVTDVMTTKTGAPSVGYTYDRENYGQFEASSGSQSFASTERDPRRLIDKSIREIAAKTVVGRFFTRRV